MTSSKFPKSLKGAGDLVVLGEFLKVGKKTRKVTKKVKKHNPIHKSSFRTLELRCYVTFPVSNIKNNDLILYFLWFFLQ